MSVVVEIFRFNCRVSHQDIQQQEYSFIFLSNNFIKKKKKVKSSLTSADKHLLHEFKLAMDNFFALTYHFEVSTDCTV